MYPHFGTHIIILFSCSNSAPTFQMWFFRKLSLDSVSHEWPQKKHNTGLPPLGHICCALVKLWHKDPSNPSICLPYWRMMGADMTASWGRRAFERSCMSLKICIIQSLVNVLQNGIKKQRGFSLCLLIQAAVKGGTTSEGETCASLYLE